jgi:excisionase family DNA binding protein
MADITPAASGLPQTVRRRLRPYALVAPLAVPPLEAARLLSCGLGHIYGLMNSGELEAFSSGRARRVTMKSVDAYVARQVAKADAKAGAPAPARRRHGRQQRKRA